MDLWLTAENEKEAEFVLFGIGIIERHYLAARKAGLVIDRLIINGPSFSNGFVDKLKSGIPVPIECDQEPQNESLKKALSRGSKVIVSRTNVLADGRLYQYLSASKQNLAAADDKDPPAFIAVLIDETGLDFVSSDIDQILAEVPRLKQEDFTPFIQRLRRSLPFYLFRINNPAKQKDVERFLFWSNYKGSTDLFTKYVYPPAVWLLVRPLAKARVHPNTVTWVSIILTFLAVPFFASGQFALGFVCAFGMSILDSVDGKLARLTYADSALGNILDHGLDVIHPPLWYLAWAWGLSSGNVHSDIFIASIVMTGFYILDRIILKIYPTLFRRGLHTHGRLDVWVRSIISRRNINLPLFLAGYYLQIAEPVFIFIVLWQVATVLYHGLRTSYILVFDRPCEYIINR